MLNCFDIFIVIRFDIPANSLFHKLPKPKNDVGAFLQRCECATTEAGASNCNPMEIVRYAGIHKDNGGRTGGFPHCGGSKRAITFSDDPSDEDFDMFQVLPSGTSHSPVRAKRAADVDISYVNATEYCREKLATNKATELCKEIANVDIDSLINQCAFDVSVGLLLLWYCALL